MHGAELGCSSIYGVDHSLPRRQATKLVDKLLGWRAIGKSDQQQRAACSQVRERVALDELENDRPYVVRL